MGKAAIALGSNLGDREAHLRDAIERVRVLGDVVAVSSFYDTEPVGYLDQPRFLNAALLLETPEEPVALMQSLLSIERDLGRDREHAIAKGPRVIDLDLLLYDDQVISSPILTLPHPAMAGRRFVLEPLTEIAPKLQHPVLRLTTGELLQALR